MVKEVQTYCETFQKLAEGGIMFSPDSVALPFTTYLTGNTILLFYRYDHAERY